MFRISEVWRDLKGSSQFLIISTIIFAVSIYVGMTNDSFALFLEAQMNALGEVVQGIDQSSNPTLSMFVFIFLNNAIKSVLVIFIGAFFGIFPIFFLAINGMLIGYIVGLTVDGGMKVTLFEMIFKLLLPHGIIEIPVLILVAAYGLRLGKLLFSTLWALMTNHSRLDHIGAQYKNTLKRCGVIAVYATFLLFVASIIESTVTVWLAGTIN